MDRETIINLPKKIFRFVLAVKTVRWLVNTGFKIYRFIPKFEKIKGIDTEKFVGRHISQ